MELTESAVQQTTAVTDLVLTVIALGCIVALRRASTENRWKAGLWRAAFGWFATASVLGAVAHGFAMRQVTNDRLWQPINLALSLTVALFALGAIYDYWGRQIARRALPWLIAVGLVFFLITQLDPQRFELILAYEALALLTALLLYLRLWLGRRLHGAGFLVGGILLSFVAAVVQLVHSLRFTLIWTFDHNGAFHLIQMLGLLVLIAGIRRSRAAGTSTPLPRAVIAPER